MSLHCISDVSFVPFTISLLPFIRLTPTFHMSLSYLSHVSLLPFIHISPTFNTSLTCLSYVSLLPFTQFNCHSRPLSYLSHISILPFTHLTSTCHTSLSYLSHVSLLPIARRSSTFIRLTPTCHTSLSYLSHALLPVTHLSPAFHTSLSYLSHVSLLPFTRLSPTFHTSLSCLSHITPLPFTFPMWNFFILSQTNCTTICFILPGSPHEGGWGGGGGSRHLISHSPARVFTYLVLFRPWEKGTEIHSFRCSTLMGGRFNYLCNRIWQEKICTQYVYEIIGRNNKQMPACNLLIHFPCILYVLEHNA
jgi:hypothetical protein